MDLLRGAADAIGDAAASAADAVGNVVSGGVLAVSAKLAEQEIKKNTGKDITVDYENVPDGEWTEWMSKTGMNSLCTDDTWAFLEQTSYNQRKIDNWDKRDLKKIIMTVKESCDSDDRWINCMPEWEMGSDTLKLVWYPHALSWAGTASWADPTGYKRWWILGDEIQFGLQLYQLPGRCFYKSDWLDGFEDYDLDSLIPNGTKKYRRWFQFRHWVMMWYGEAMWGYNWAWGKPPKNPDGSDFSLDNVLSCPSLPDFSMPRPRLPSLPDMPDISMPDVSMPDMPSISAPSLSAPSFDLSAPSLPSIPDRKKRSSNKWAAHGMIELPDLCVLADGKDVIFSNANVKDFLEKDGHIDTEEKERQRYVLTTTDAEQAKSWEETLAASGCEVKDAGGGCCVVA